MRYFFFAALPLLACQVDASYPQPYAQVQVQTPPPPQVDVNAQVDPNAQPVDPNAQAQGGGDATDVADTDPSAVTDFHDALAPYGTWQDDPQYGTIWQPSPAVVGGDFTPYQTAGHWTYDTDYTWVSDYDWGWAPFHYGRWTTIPGRGWGWIPGKEYAGAWVTWRNGDDGYGFVGWAPTAPSYYWRGGSAVVLTSPWFEPSYSYVETTNLFVPTLGVRIIRDPVRIREFAVRTRVYAPVGGYVVGGGGVRMRVRGPAPTRIGLHTETLPHPPVNNHAAAYVHVQQTTFHPSVNAHANVNANVNASTHTSATAAMHTEPTHTSASATVNTAHQPESHSVATTSQVHTATPTPTPSNQNRRPPPPSTTHTHH